MFNINDVVDFNLTPKPELKSASIYYHQEKIKYEDKLSNLIDYKDQILIKVPFFEYINEVHLLESSIKRCNNIIDIISMCGIPCELTEIEQRNIIKH